VLVSSPSGRMARKIPLAPVTVPGTTSIRRASRRPALRACRAAEKDNGQGR
jgi:hypothetical protein